jgi:excinuclease ABC subunit C
MMTSSLVEEQLKRLPSSPGVYLMKDSAGNIIYVGKAANLRNRVRSYFKGGRRLPLKTAQMVGRVSELDFLITASEQEALILELNLIKRHRPRYNVSLKDGKTFPYLKVDLSQDWPRVYSTRRLEENGGRYFGPFASARSVRQTLKVLKEIFPFRSCSRPIEGTRARPCLNYHIGRCLGPCIEAVGKEDYAEIIKQVVLFLEGKQGAVVCDLEKKMAQAAKSLDFERAALLRDRVAALSQVVEGQQIAAKVSGEQDVIAFVEDKGQACVQVFFIRSGRLVGRESFVLEGTRLEAPSQIMAGFVEQYYHSALHIPPLITLQHPVDDAAVITGWLSGKRGGRVRLLVPRRGSRKQLVDIVAENAREGLEQLKIKRLAKPRVLEAALAELKEKLDLAATPSRIEGYDISNIQGKEAVGSMVVFEDGKAKPAHYRRFRIKTVTQADDYAMLYEVLSRRFKRLSGATDAWAVLPGLILIDGGKGQLNAALSCLNAAGVDSVAAASLAKEGEEIFIPRKQEAIVLPRSSPALQLLQRVRDEAHRFALGYHLKVRRRAGMTSALDGVPGIGPKRRRMLLREFGSVVGIRRASEEELALAKGMNRDLAKKIKEYL